MRLIHRPRRLRRTDGIRRLRRETRLSPSSLILPFFVQEGENIREDIRSLPGVVRYSPDTLPRGIEAGLAAGAGGFLLFGVPAVKDAEGSGAWNPGGVVQQALRRARARFPEALLISDVCLCEYTSHGCCGIPGAGGPDNDETVALLAKTALSHAEAGADMVAPSDMMDGRIGAIRAVLDENGFEQTAIMSYAVKFASSFYGPFREAAGSASGFGDRKGHQMDFHNRKEALLEAELDIGEGADILMVKPALPCLDIVSDLAAATNLPLAVYSVSGEYAMVKAAAAAGLIDEYGVMCESAVAAFRAGADMLITYYAAQLAEAMRKGDIG